MEPRIQSQEDSPRLSTLVGEIVTDVQTLVRQELRLARTELKQDWVRVKNATALFIGATIFGALGFGFALLALAHGFMALGFPPGFAYALVGGGLLAVGLCCYFLAKRWLKAMSAMPEISEHLSEATQMLTHGPKIEILKRPVEGL